MLPGLCLPPFAVAGTTGGLITYRGRSIVTPSTGVSIGAEAPDRLVVVAVEGVRTISPGRTITGVTIGGVAATIHGQTNGGGSKTCIGIASLVVPTGTTTDIAVTFSAAIAGIILDVYTFVGLTSATPTGTISPSSNTGDAIGTLNIPSGGCVVAIGGSDTVDAVTLTGVTQDAAGPNNSFAYSTVGHAVGLSAETGRIIKASSAAPTDLLVATVWA